MKRQTVTIYPHYTDEGHRVKSLGDAMQCPIRPISMCVAFLCVVLGDMEAWGKSWLPTPWVPTLSSQRMGKIVKRMT